jgi:hypothetical protein
VGEEKPSRRAQREREAYYKAAQVGKNTNGKSVADIDQSPDDDSDDERSRTSKFKLIQKMNSLRIDYYLFL